MSNDDDEWVEEHLARIQRYFEGVAPGSQLTRSQTLRLLLMQWEWSYGSRSPMAPTHGDAMNAWEDKQKA